MKKMLILFGFVLSCGLMGEAHASGIDALLTQYRSEGAGPFHAEQGKEFLNRVNQGGPNQEGNSCASCHTQDPRQPGKHVKTGKPIEPLAPVKNPERLQDVAKVEKWFLRNCKGTLGRTCTPQEKGDFLTFLTSIQ